MSNLSLSLLFILLGLGISISSCDKDDDEGPSYIVPTSYNFTNVSYSGQTQRLNQFSEIKAYMASSQEMGVALNLERLQAMYANDGANAGWAGTYEESKQLRGKTLVTVQADFDALLEELATASQSIVAGTAGVSGVITSLDGTKSYLIGEDGLDHAQLFEKGLMGACLYYQATGVYFGDERMNVDNELIEAGTGTAMEHHWDEAFGYFGVPVDFPADKDGLVFWGNYSNNRDAVLGSNQLLMDALLKGRAAISAKDLAGRDEAIAEARANWELIAVGSALHYLNSGMANFDDMALRGHDLSEGIGFIYALQFNPERKISTAQIDELLELIAGSATFAEMNLYQAELSQLQMAKDQLADYYNLADQKDEF